MVQSQPILLALTAMVSELIDGDSKWWNYSLLELIFSLAKVRLIQSIPLSRTNREDVLIWRGTTNGVFSVWSAYHMQKERESVGQTECSSRVPNSEVWRTLWKLLIPNVEKNFL